MKVDLNLAPVMFEILELSNAHIPEHTARAIDGGYMPEGIMLISVHDTGWMFYMADPLPRTTLRLQGHGELAALLALAEKHGCYYLKLDADAQVVDGLPIFDW